VWEATCGQWLVACGNGLVARSLWLVGKATPLGGSGAACLCRFRQAQGPSTSEASPDNVAYKMRHYERGGSGAACLRQKPPPGYRVPPPRVAHFPSGGWLTFRAVGANSGRTGEGAVTNCVDVKGAALIGCQVFWLCPPAEQGRDA